MFSDFVLPLLVGILVCLFDYWLNHRKRK
ncbi:type I toxin-antitoxin system Fst family toxin [Furfurilactobacillus siliginis]|nr:type I toxin-antitoxin system Fst family toxin [Furfurilactobacillus siliginis]